MAIKVVLSNASRITRRTPAANTSVEGIEMSRETYQKLGSLVKNKTILADYDAGRLTGEYKRLLDELNDLYLVKNYPQLSSGIVLSDHIVELDEYLGSLGIGIDYPYSKDSVNIPNWLDGNPDKTPVRYLVDTSDNTFLTANGGTEILVTYEG